MNRFEYVLLILSGIIYGERALNSYDLLPLNGLVSYKTSCLSCQAAHMLLVCIISTSLGETQLRFLQL